MRSPLFLLCLFLVGGGAASQVRYYHRAHYLVGGYDNPFTLVFWSGIFVADFTTPVPTLKRLTPAVGACRSAVMDADNRAVVFAAGPPRPNGPGLQHGLFRVDPATLKLTTILYNPQDLYDPRHCFVNQDGDYIVAVAPRGTTTSTALLKVAWDGSAVTTLFTGMYQLLDIGIDIETGYYCIAKASPSGAAFLLLAHDGTVLGPVASDRYLGPLLYDGWSQDFDTSAIEWQYFGTLYSLPRGQGLLKIFRYGWFGSQWGMGYTSRYDLQSAPRRRVVGTGTESRKVQGTWYSFPAIFYADRSSPVATFVSVSPVGVTTGTFHPSYTFAFFRGRHLSSVRLGPRKWRLLVSCPSFPGRRYLLLPSLSGFRPPLRLQDGRRLYLVPDTVTVLALAGLLRPLFDPGPGRLDARGEARGTLDLSAFGKLGTPLWLAAVILDEQGQVLYVPDTYVMRL